MPILINNGIDNGDFGYKTGIRDKLNFAPRVGFAYNVGGKNDLVIRGGSGIYFNFPVSNVTYSQQFYNRSITAVFLPTNKGFTMENPTRGVDARADPVGRHSDASAADDDHRARLPESVRLAELDRIPEAARAADGVRRRLDGPRRDAQVRSRDVNLFYDPVTGYNIDPTIYGRPNPA